VCDYQRDIIGHIVDGLSRTGEIELNDRGGIFLYQLQVSIPLIRLRSAEKSNLVPVGEPSRVVLPPHFEDQKKGMFEREKKNQAYNSRAGLGLSPQGRPQVVEP
jgi:hypothetical protein